MGYSRFSALRYRPKVEENLVNKTAKRVEKAKTISTGSTGTGSTGVCRTTIFMSKPKTFPPKEEGTTNEGTINKI